MLSHVVGKRSPRMAQQIAIQRGNAASGLRMNSSERKRENTFVRNTKKSHQPVRTKTKLVVKNELMYNCRDRQIARFRQASSQVLSSPSLLQP